MASVVGICNSALVKMGASRIIQMTEGSKNANLCNEQYEKVRDDILRSHIWNFAVKRTKLAQLTETPTFGFNYEYQLPADFLRVVSVHPNDSGSGLVAYKIEGRKLLTNSTEIYLRYIYQVTDPNDMDALFRETLAYALASDLAIPITQSTTTREQMKDGLKRQLSKAKSIDAIEDYPETEPEPAWVSERN
jgi:hypothetical protein